MEDGPLLRGAAVFADDLETDALHVAFLRSPVAHARIASIDVGAAREAPGVVAVLTAADLGLADIVTPCTAPGAVIPPRPVLARDTVRFAGEAVLAVVASSRYEAEDALELCWVEYDELPVVSDPEAALEPGSPLVHEDGNRYIELRVENGEVDAAFASAACVVERRLRHPRSAALPLEGRALVAAPDGDGLVLHSSTQGPHKLSLAVGEVLGLPRERVRVICTDIGGGFGLKAHVYPEEIAVAAIARRLGRAVRWAEDRSENLLASSHARDQRLDLRVAADAEGRLLAIDLSIVVDQGAYGLHPHGATLEALTSAGLTPGPYTLGAYRVRSRAAATNKCPQGAYRGVGFVTSVLVHERAVELVAAALGMDAADVRRRNLIPASAMPFTSLMHQRYDSGDYRASLDRALDEIGYATFPAERRRALAEGRLLGLGVAFYVEPTGMNSKVFEGRGMVGVEGFDGAHVSLDAEGRATVWTTTPTIGQGTDTTFAQVVAGELGLDFDQVRVAHSDTSVGGITGTGSFASRSAVSAGGAAISAGTQVRERLLEDAGERLEIAVGDLEIVGGEIRAVGSPDRAVSIRDLAAAAAPGRYAVSAQWDPPFVAYPYATHAVRVEVDAETGGVTLDRYVIVEDCGRVINPLVVEGQVHGATAQGIASALYEAIAYDEDGQLQTGSLMDFLVPTAGEVPSFEVSHLETPSPDTAGGFKGVGEGGTVGAPVAVANAVASALGIEVNELPATPEFVRAAAQRALGAAA